MFTKAKWIWKKEYEKEDIYVDFLDSFKSTGKNTYLYLSADSNYLIYLNNKYVYSVQYPDYPFYKIYDKIDLTPYLNDNSLNELKITVWYYGRSNFGYYKGNAGLIYEVVSKDNVLAYSSKDTLCKLSDGFVQENKKNITWQLGFSFKYDPNIINEKTEYSVEIIKELNLYPRPNKLLNALPYRKASLVNNTTSIYDFKKESYGYIKIKYLAKKGEIIRLAFGEHIADNNVRYKVNWSDNYNFTFELVGTGEEVEFTNYFRRFGLRYLEVISGDVEIIELGLIPVEYPTIDIEFNSKNKLRNTIYKTAQETLKLSMHEHYEDCPWREQAYYSMDGRLEMLFSYYAFKGFEQQRAAHILMCKSKRNDNLLSITAPTDIDMCIPSFNLSFIISLYDYYKHTKDINLLEDCYKVCEKIIDVFLKNMEDGLVKSFDNYWNFFEWSDGLDGNITCNYKFNAALNSIFSLAILNYINILDVLKIDNSKYKEIQKSLNKRINEVFYNEKECLYSTFGNDTNYYHELVNAWAILSGVAKGKEQLIADKLINHDSKMIRSTLSMSTFVYEALLLVDFNFYRDRILKEIDEIFSFMIKSGATSFWETIDGEKAFEGMGSLCHGWSALPIYFYQLLKAE